MSDEPNRSIIIRLKPEALGWKPLGPRLWQRPDGKIYQFAAGESEVVYEYRQVRAEEVLKIDA